MHLLQVISVLLGFVMASSAFPKAPVANVAQDTGLSDRVNIADFQVSLFLYQAFIYFPLRSEPWSSFGSYHGI
jgi:hypothetical protein